MAPTDVKILATPQFDYDIEWGGEDGAGRQSTSGGLAECPLSNLLYNPSQTTTLKLSTVVQYMRVIKRTQPLSKKVQILTRDAAELQGLPVPARMGAGGGGGPGDFVAASRKQDAAVERAVSPMAMDIERVMSTLLNGAYSGDSFETGKELIDIAKRAIFGSSSAPECALLQRVVENRRFLNHECPMYERVALNCARVVLKEKAGEVFATGHHPFIRERSKSRPRKPRRSVSPTNKPIHMNANGVLPTKFVDRRPGDDVIVLCKKGPQTLTRHGRGSTPSDASHQSTMWTPPEISTVEEVKCGKCGHTSSNCTASMSWKLDELLQVRKTCDDLTEERDKAVGLYQEAVGFRKRAQKDCKEAQQVP